MARGVPEVLQVRAAGHVEPAPQRLARHRHEQVAPHATRAISATVCSGSGTCSSTSIAAASVELAVGERQVLGLHDLVLEVRRLALLPLGLQQRVLQVDADDAAAADALRPLLGQHALAAADVEERGGRRLRRTARRACPRSRAISRRTTGLVEPYLS